MTSEYCHTHLNTVAKHVFMFKVYPNHCPLFYRCLHTEDEFFLKSMREAINEILTDVSDSFSHMIDMALANEIQV